MRLWDKTWLSDRLPQKALMLCGKLRDYYQYYGIRGTYKALERTFRSEGVRGTYKALERTFKSPKLQRPQRPQRPCHIHELFITHNGDIYPCCLVWMRDDMKIAHLNDLNFVEKIKAFNRKCACEKFHLRRMLPTETINFAKFNIEFSLACQGNCAMCCVGAPSWHGNYDYYDKLAKLVDAFTPASLFVQGGEVLVQTKTLSWLKTIKETYPDTRITIITNGNVDVKLLEQVEEIFSGIYISFVGFQPATYKRIMGMDVEKAKRFAENLIARKKIRKVILKYLTTPSNIHETSVFLEWSISLSPTSCLFQDSNIFQYVNLRTNDDYWHKIFERTSQELKTVILKNKTHFLSSKMTVSFDSYCRDIFKIDDAFIQENGLENIVSWHK